MRISLNQLKKLTVETKSGFVLGHIKDIILETEGQLVLQYAVGSLVGKKYLISREQVISIDDKKMIVDDGMVGVGTGLDLPTKKMKIEPEGVMTSETGN